MRKEKPLLLDEIKQKIDASTGFIVVRYDRLEPNASWEIRDSLSKSGSLFEVVRKRVFQKAAEKAGIQLDEALLKGHVGIVFVNQPDTMASTKTVYKFSGKEGILEVLYGRFEGKIVPAQELEMLSKLPGINEMRATMIALFTSPMSQMLSTVEAKIAASNSDSEQKS